MSFNPLLDATAPVVDTGAHTVADGGYNAPMNADSRAIDATPMAVATIVTLAALGVWGLNKLNFKFVIGVGK